MENKIELKLTICHISVPVSLRDTCVWSRVKVHLKDRSIQEKITVLYNLFPEKMSFLFTVFIFVISRYCHGFIRLCEELSVRPLLQLQLQLVSGLSGHPVLLHVVGDSRSEPEVEMGEKILDLAIPKLAVVFLLLQS